MFESLLPYYNSELRYMRELSKGFAAANPKIASRLRISDDAIEDPHVSRLIEAFAFLNARLRMKLDDDFPELTESLLGLLYPHYLAPIPSMSIVEMTPRATLKGCKTVTAGARLTTEAVDGESCEFRTGYDVELWPIELVSARLSGLPLAAPTNRKFPAAQGVLRLSLACINTEDTFLKFGLDRLRIHIHAEPRTSQILYELILGGTLSVALANSAVDDAPVILDRGAIQTVGLSRKEALLPQAHGSEIGYTLVSEFFAFPEKFLFFDIVGLSAKTLLNAGRTMEVFLYLDRFEASLENLISKSDFRLFCSPVINLFEMKADPVRLDPGKFEHRIVPDARRETTLEIYSVDEVVVTNRSGEELPYRPFYAFGKRNVGKEATSRFWHAARRESVHAGGGDDLLLSVVDPQGNSAGDRDHVASINITATNRNLPSRLPFGNGHPSLRLNADPSVAQTICLNAPTRPLRPDRGRANLWRLISHLSLNHVSVASDGAGSDIVREMLALYDKAEASSSRTLIDRLVGVTAAQSIARAPGGGRIAFTSGTNITLEFEDSRLSGSGAFMLGAVLDTLFSGLSAINAFSRVQLKLKSEKGLWHVWQARTGTRPLI